ncbi:RNA-protein complex protein Nop10 [Candidatus Bathyarchaeota archaeon]|nr:RNA-protein complex protein Nop10 [Candidatus Bathyarchaeota archaeon]
MVWLLRRCTKCRGYTLKETCPFCGGEAVSPHPAKFSLDDKYRKYKLLMRRMAQEKADEA